MSKRTKKQIIADLLAWEKYCQIESKARRSATPKLADAFDRTAECADKACDAMRRGAHVEAMSAMLDMVHWSRMTVGERLGPDARTNWHRMSKLRGNQEVESRKKEEIALAKLAELKGQTHLSMKRRYELAGEAAGVAGRTVQRYVRRSQNK